MPAAIRRLFGIADDTVAGGTPYDTLNAAGSAPTDSTLFWPVTGGTLEPTLERIDRRTEVRGRRAVSPPLTFRAGPVMTVPGPAYRSIVEKLLKKTLGGADTVTGSAAAGYTHTIAPLGFGSTQLPPMHVQMVRDDLNHKMSGAMSNRLALSFPLDGEGTFETELHGLYHANYGQVPPTPTYTDVDNVLMLRDAQVFLDGAGTALTTPTAPTLAASNSGGTLAAGTYNYRIVAYNSNGQTLPGPEAASPATTTGSTGSVVVTWTAVTGAVGYRVYGRAVGAELFLADVGGALTFTDVGGLTPSGALPTANTTGGAVPDIIGVDFSFVNNLLKKWYARRNVWTQTIGLTPNQRVSKLWYPSEFKLGAEQDVTYALHFGNTNTAQDLARDFAQVQKIVLNIQGGVVPGSTPSVYESLQITIYNAVHAAGGGADALAARGDTTYRVEGGGFYSNADGADIQVQILNSLSTPLT